MSLIRAPLEHDDTANQHDWSAPLAMLIAWLVRIFDQITRIKRIRHTTRFKANWRDHWQNLRQLEWMRDQILGDCARRLLAGETLDDESDFIPSTDPPADYGGPCPRTPYEMNRRFLAIARFNADPESAIREHVRRIAKRAGIDLGGCPLRLAAQATSPALRAEEESTCACRECVSSSGALRRGRWIATSSSRDGGGSRKCRGPPQTPQIQHFPTRAHPRERARLCVLDAPPPQPYLAPVCTATRSSRRAPIGGAT